MPDVVVIGGGVIGAALAYRLSRAGEKVTLLEAGQLGSGASGSSFAWTNSNDKQPFEYHLLNAGGMGEHLVLSQEFGSAPWLHQVGNFEWTTPERHTALQDKVKRLHAWGYHAEFLSRADVAGLEPDIALPGDVEQVAYYPDEGYIDGPLFVGALLQAAQRHGAQVRTHSRVTHVVREAGSVAGIVTADGLRLPADVVVSCTGRWSNELAEIAAVDVPMAPNVGLLAITSPSPVGLRVVVHTPEVNVRPEGGGRIMVRAGEFDLRVQSDTPTVPVPGVCNEILERAVRILPRLAGASIEAARIAIRSIPSDSYPLVGPLPGWSGLYVIATHSGVTMAPLLARMLTTEILTGRVDPRLATFRPERLVNAPAAD
jgi:glycine/D-amino acid oxidase-like deaminating enzyme